jgi:hypothetical protein
MNTYSIGPSDELAGQVADQVETLLNEGHDYVAVIGEYDAYNDTCTVYTVQPAPADYPQRGYEWAYCDAADWLRKFNSLRR